MDYTFNVPINSVSFGAASIALLREAYKLGHSPCIIPIGNQIDLSAQKEDKDFNLWLQSCLNKGLRSHKRNNPVFKLWHLSGALESISNKQILFSFYELDEPTPEEINVVKNNHKVIFACDYNTNTFKDYGCENVETIPLGFDSFNFGRLNKQYFNDGRITFGLAGKSEFTRKRTEKVIKSWIKRFGNNNRYFLDCAIHNVFLNPEQNNQLYQKMTDGVRYFNIQFLPFMQQNSVYNDYLNHLDIIIGMGTESFGLPEFQATAIGCHSVISNYGGHKQWANSNNSVLVNPSSKIPVYDQMFFNKGGIFNQGNVYDFSEDEFINSCEEAIKRVEQNKINESGLELQEKFKYSNTFKKIYELLES